MSNVRQLLPTAAFTFGNSKQHHAELVFGLLGSEKYFVNGHLVHSHWSFMPSGVREFIAEGHRVQIRTSVGLRTADGEAWVDGELVEAELFAAFNEKICQRRLKSRGGGARLGILHWLLKVAVWFVIAFVTLSIIKAFRGAP